MRATTWRATVGQQAERLLAALPVKQFSAAALRSDFGLNALDFVELMLEVEMHFDFRFTAAELHDLRYAQQVLDRAGPAHRRQLYAEFFAGLMQHDRPD